MAYQDVRFASSKQVVPCQFSAVSVVVSVGRTKAGLKYSMLVSALGVP